MRLKATTLLETIVASLIFLLVFGMAMEALAHIHKISDPDWSAMERSFNEFRDSSVVMSDGLREYPWGTMRWARESAFDTEGLVVINVTANMKGGQKIEYHYFRNESGEI